MDCEDSATFGPYERWSSAGSSSWAPYENHQSFLIDVPTPGAYRLDIDDPETIVLLERCLDDHPATKAELETGFQGLALVELEHPALWRVDVLRPHGPPVDVWLTSLTSCWRRA